MSEGDALAPVVAVAVPATYVVAVAAIVAEALLLARARVRSKHREAWVSLASGALAFGLLHLANLALYLRVLEAAYAHRVLEPGLRWPAWLGAFLLYDLAFYVGHRAGHEVRLLWCFHSVHHTPEDMRLTTAIRGSAFDFLYLPWFFAWIPLFGFHPAMLLVVESVSRTWGVLTHVAPQLFPSGTFRGPLAPLASVLVTPSAHRVHHARNDHYLDRNYGEVLFVWDRLFGSAAVERVAPTYGVLAPVDPSSLADVQLSPWGALLRDLRRAPDLAARVRYLLDAPGWSHDGPDHRVRARRRTGVEPRAPSDRA